MLGGSIWLAAGFCGVGKGSQAFPWSRSPLAREVAVGGNRGRSPFAAVRRAMDTAGETNVFGQPVTPPTMGMEVAAATRRLLGYHPGLFGAAATEKKEPPKR